MKLSDIFFFSQKNYPAMEAFLKSNDAPQEVKKELLQMIEDHKHMTQYAKQIALEQKIQAEKMFNPFKTEHLPPRLFDEGLELNKTADDNPIQEPNNPETKENKKREKNGKSNLKNNSHNEIIQHCVAESDKKCSCCKKNMTKSYTLEKTVVMSLPLFKTYTHEIETFRCIDCARHVAAPVTQMLEETIGRYHYSAVANLASLRYLWGMPAYRIEAYSKNVGLRISDATHFYLMEQAADKVFSFYNALKLESFKAPVKYIDDTRMLVISLMNEIKKEKENVSAQGGDPSEVRSGIHTSQLTAEFSPNRKIALYQTGIQHSGEFLEQIMAARTLEEKVIVMSDASSSNFSKNINIKTPILNAACNFHARRNFFDLKDIYVEHVDQILKLYAQVFKNDAHCKKCNLKGPERLLYHQNHSVPVMNALYLLAKDNLEKKGVEPNSKLGKAYNYIIKHWDKLSLFLKEENAPVSNNEAERMLKVAIRHRKNSLFYKTDIGAKVGDILMTILVTAHYNNINANEYLEALLKYQKIWKKNPEPWLPWNFKATLEKVQKNTQLN